MGAPGILRYGVHAGGDARAGIQPAADSGAGHRVHRRRHGHSMFRGRPTGVGVSATAACDSPRGGDSCGKLVFDAQIAAEYWKHGIDGIPIPTDGTFRISEIRRHAVLAAGISSSIAALHQVIPVKGTHGSKPPP